MRNLKSILVIMLALLVVGCGSLKLPNPFHVNPSPLVNNGGKVSFSIQDTIQPKSFPKKMVAKLQPYMKFGADTINLKPILLKGEKAEGAGTVVNWKTTTPLVYKTTFDYKPEMQVSELWVKVYTISKGEATEVSDLKIADGIVITSSRVGQSEVVAYAPDGYEKETIISKSENLYFGYQKSNLNTGLKLNKDNKDNLDSLNDFFAQGWKIKSVSVNAWASPEGEQSLNQKLSDERGVTAKKYLEKKAKSNKIEDEITYNVVAKGADYDGFMAALNASDIEDKNKIGNVIKSQATKSQREQQIRNMTVIYKEVEDMLSVLRRAEMTISLYEPKLTDAQIAEYATSNPDTLKINELLYAATMTEDLNTKLAIYKSAIKKNEKCWRAYNNAAAVDIKLGNADEAAQYLEKANSLKASQGEVENNLGVLAAWNKDYEAAEKHYSNASGVNTDYNMGIIKMVKGDYVGAEIALSDPKCTYNLALAQLSNNKTDEAIKTLDCAEKTGEVYYLYAIIGARTNNTNLLYDNLKKAIKEVPSYKEEAKKDLEFYKFKDVAEFQNILK